jgi:single-stranded DNA-specific DHH superfamily exonuclease
MFHPLAPSLESLKDEELHRKISELLQRLNSAQRTGDPQLIMQLQMLYDGFQEESQKRAQVWLERLNKKKKDTPDDKPNFDIG